MPSNAAARIYNRSAVETELLGTAEPGLQARPTTEDTETLTCVGSDTPAQTIADDATDVVQSAFIWLTTD